MIRWVAAVLIIALGLQVILFWPGSTPSDDKMQINTIEEYQQSLQEYNDLLRKRNELEELQLKFLTGKAWSA